MLLMVYNGNYFYEAIRQLYIYITNLRMSIVDVKAEKSPVKEGH